MKYFEYLRSSIPLPPPEQYDTWPDKCIAWLNRYGRDGWEIVRIELGPFEAWALFKREIQGETY